MWPSRMGLAVLLLALCCAAAQSDDGRKRSDDPDPGFLEFLGSVDRLAEVNPDYLSQAAALPGRQAGKGASSPAPASPPPPPSGPSAPSGSHNE